MKYQPRDYLKALGIFLVLYLLLVYRWDLDSELGFYTAGFGTLLVVSLWEFRQYLRQIETNQTRVSELVIVPKVGLLDHPQFKPFHDCLEEKLEKLPKEKVDLLLEDALIRKEIRFVIYNQLVWSEARKTFQAGIGIQDKLYDDVAKKVLDSSMGNEPYFSIRCKNGFLSVHLMPDTDDVLKKEELKALENPICRFPLFIFEDIPIRHFNFSLMGDDKKPAKLYSKLKRMSPEKWVKNSSKILEMHGFKYIETGFPFTSFGEGMCYENEYIRIRYASLE